MIEPAVCRIPAIALALALLTACDVAPATAGRAISYLDQPPPGDRPEVFAPEILRVPPGVHSAAVFSPDGATLLWSPMARSSETLRMRRVDGRWTGPERVDFGLAAGVGDPFFAPDGGRLYFLSFQPTDAHPVARERIWFVERAGDGWGAPHLVDDVVVAHPTHWQFSVAQNRDLYFTSEVDGVRGEQDLFVSRYVDGRYQDPEDLGARVNSDGKDLTPFIAPDQSFLLFARIGEDTDGADLHASFRDAAGAWTRATPLREWTDTGGHELCPVVSPDGRYLFFTGRRGEGYGVYWMDATFLSRVRDPLHPALSEDSNGRSAARLRTALRRYDQPPVPGIQPLQLLLTSIVGWVHREQAAPIAYLVEENRVLKQQLHGRRLRPTDDQRRCLAAKGNALGRRLLSCVATIVTPDTILRWHRRQIAAK